MGKMDFDASAWRNQAARGWFSHLRATLRGIAQDEAGDPNFQPSPDWLVEAIEHLNKAEIVFSNRMNRELPDPKPTDL